MDPKFDPSPFLGTKPSVSIEMTRHEAMMLQKKIKTPSFTTSEDPIHQRRKSILLSKHGEPNMITPLVELDEDAIVQPNEIELFSRYDGSPGNSPVKRGARSKGMLDTSMNAHLSQNDFMRLSVARVSTVDLRGSKAYNSHGRKSIVRPDATSTSRTTQPTVENGFFWNWYNRLYNAFCGCDGAQPQSTNRTSTNNFTYSNSLVRGSFAYSFVVLPDELKKAEASRKRQISEK